VVLAAAHQGLVVLVLAQLVGDAPQHLLAGVGDDHLAVVAERDRVALDDEITRLARRAVGLWHGDRAASEDREIEPGRGRVLERGRGQRRGLGGRRGRGGGGLPRGLARRALAGRLRGGLRACGLDVALLQLLGEQRVVLLARLL